MARREIPTDLIFGDEEFEKEQKKYVTFSYGTAVGVGAQALLTGASYEETILQAFFAWDVDLDEEDSKSKKSFWTLMTSLMRLNFMLKSGLLDGYEPVKYNGKFTSELGFRVTIPYNGKEYKLRGYMDLVLQHKETKEVIVLECKTTGAKALNPLSYKNSAQATSYSVVLDKIFKDLSSFRVKYLINTTMDFDWTVYDFLKTPQIKAQWLTSLLQDIKTLDMYIEDEHFPMRGSSCLSFNRECPYAGSCELDNSMLFPTAAEELEKLFKEEEDYDIEVNFEDLVNAELELAE